MDKLLCIYSAVPPSRSRQTVIPGSNASSTYVGIWGWLNGNSLGGISLGRSSERVMWSRASRSVYGQRTVAPPGGNQLPGLRAAKQGEKNR